MNTCRSNTILIAITLLAFFSSLPAAQAQNQILKRKILGLYNAKENHDDVFFSSFHQAAEMPLNHLGYIVEYHDINTPLPETHSLTDYTAVISWFDSANSAAPAKNYCEWLNAILDQGLKVIILSRFGFIRPGIPIAEECTRVLQRIGIKYDGEQIKDPLLFAVKSKDSSMVEFERRIQLSENFEYEHISPVSENTKSYITLTRTDLENMDSHPVTLSPNGGYVHTSFLTYFVSDLNLKQWRLNPFLYFSKVLGIQDWPKPDTTTKLGRRLYYSHIDGDGIFNISQINRKSYSGEILVEQFFRKHTSLPVTFGLITGYFDLPEFNGKRAQQLYRNLFSLPNIQAAAHGYAHPLIWNKGTVSLKIPGYQFSSVKETYDSVLMTRRLMSDLGILKPVNLFQWTGDCLTSELDVQLLDDQKILNMNGGDTRFDHLFPSHTFVYPLTLQRGKHRQYYSSGSNENIYTNHWRGPHHTFRQVIETFDNTESPRRLKPINFYYHAFNGERLASMNALNEVQDYVLKQKIHAITAAEYPEILKGFFDMHIERTSPRSWMIKGNGKLRTVRFDSKVHVDMQTSSGVLGYKHDLNVTYIHLDEQPIHQIHLSHVPTTKPFIEEASFHMDSVTISSDSIKFTKIGWHRPIIHLRNVSPDSRFQLKVDGKPLGTFRSDDKGTLHIEFPRLDTDSHKETVVIERIIEA